MLALDMQTIVDSIYIYKYAAKTWKVRIPIDDFSAKQTTSQIAMHV